MKKLKINSLSLAKYFYEKGIEDATIIQKLIYLTYLEVLEEENILLDFGEEWQAWLGGPVLETVFSAMTKKWDENYENIFTGIPSLEERQKDQNINISKHCEIWTKYYFKCEKQKTQYKIAEESQNQPRELARNKVKNYLENEKIELSDIKSFVYRKQAAVRRAKQ